MPARLALLAQPPFLSSVSSCVTLAFAYNAHFANPRSALLFLFGACLLYGYIPHECQRPSKKFVLGTTTTTTPTTTLGTLQQNSIRFGVSSMECCSRSSSKSKIQVTMGLDLKPDGLTAARTRATTCLQFASYLQPSRLNRQPGLTVRLIVFVAGLRQPKSNP